MYYLFDLTTNVKNYGAIPDGEDANNTTGLFPSKNNNHKKKEDPFSRYHIDDPLRPCNARDYSSSDGDDDDDSDDIESYQRLVSIDDVLQQIGMGFVQYRIFFVCGLLLVADSMESAILVYLSKVLRHEWNVTVIESDMIVWIGAVGAISGSLFFGMLSDILGRKPMIIASCIILAFFGCVTSIIPSSASSPYSYEFLFLGRLVVGFGMGGVTVPFDLLAEWLPNRSTRGRHLLYVQLFWTAGSVLIFLLLESLPIEAWRRTLLLCSIPSILAAVIAVVGIPESPRWLLSHGRSSEALQLLRQATTINGKEFSRMFPEHFIVLYSNELTTRERDGSSSSNTPWMDVCQLCSIRWMKIGSCILTTYFGYTFLYHGCIAMAVSVFAQDSRQQDYQAIFSTSAECLGILGALLVINRYGRIPAQLVSYGLGGVCCLILAIWYQAPIDNGNVLLIMSFMARLFIYGAGCVTWISTTEVLATDIRCTGHALAKGISGRVGDMLSTMIMSRISQLPTVGLVLFVMSVWIAMTASDIPETKVKDLGSSYEFLGSHPSSSSRSRRRSGARR